MAIKYWGGGKVTGVESDTMPTNAQTGWHFYETDTDSLHLYTGSAWDALGGGSSDIQQATSTKADGEYANTSLNGALQEGSNNPTSYGNIPNKTVTFTPTAGNSVAISGSCYGWVQDSDSNGTGRGWSYVSILVGGAEKKVVSNEFTTSITNGYASGGVGTIYIHEDAAGSSTAFGARFKIVRESGDGTHGIFSSTTAVEIG